MILETDFLVIWADGVSAPQMLLAAPKIQRYPSRMELRHLRYFLAVAETLNFSRAAGRLRVAQPALSRQIHDLEEELGFRLFERTTTKVRLTEAGRFFQQQAGKLLMQLDIAVTGAQRVAKGATGEFRIGTDWSASKLFITDAARELHERHPELSIDFVELPPHEHTQAIRDRKIDVGFLSRNRLTPRKDIDFCPIYTSTMKAILPMKHPLADRPEVRLRELEEERWITIDEEEIPGYKSLLKQMLRPAQFAPKFGRSARSIVGMLAFVATDEGIALIPELLLPAEPMGLRYLATDCAPWEMCALWSKDHAGALVPVYLEILQGKIGAAKMAPAPLKRPFRRSLPQTGMIGSQ
jgi:DNA-binding transcriptional LysR family regulator